MAQGFSSTHDAPEVVFSLPEVANHLNVSPDALQRLSRRFGQYLGSRVYDQEPAYTNTDIAALVTVQQLLAQGYDDDEIARYLVPVRQEPGKQPVALASLQDVRSRHEESNSSLSKTVSDVLNTITNSQQAVLNSQSALKDVLGVVTQDNFNLKDENRKLRDRMLDLERTLAEYQRREETRKERQESRLRALESTVAALQQQVAQMVQLYRQQTKRRGWFG
jgi:regulator of replication initiation timing